MARGAITAGGRRTRMAGDARSKTSNNTNEPAVTERSRPCPMCKRPSAHHYRPFCSRRCADLDLSRWLSGRYAIAGGDADEDEDGDQARASDLVRGGQGGGDLGGG
ncbi:MAG: DNA gyrase inhibitor YacG [Alphaproteobacteria bacterium]|nr:DNA gyrase inhibitor YacG [Alphaproteobacteria bacterium]